MKHAIFSAIAATLMGCVSAQAGEFGDVRQVVVHYDDINVNKQAGAQILMARIEAASHVVCGPAPGISDFNARDAYRVCADGAVSHAVASLPFNLMANLDATNNSETVAQR